MFLLPGNWRKLLSRCPTIPWDSHGLHEGVKDCYLDGERFFVPRGETKAKEARPILKDTTFVFSFKLKYNGNNIDH